MSQKSKFDQDLKVLQAEDLNRVSGGLIGPDQDLSQFPRKFWPVINPGAFNVKTVVANLVVR
ncbi:hypothetical protein A1353_11830 [Methylomonas methanica]|uniref:Uncharacterized protein n=2 Tax=Methylomonas TaxID=416 RepID=A0A177MK00_METMH|nr:MULTISPECIES: hypothetical protein [Methylomonas]MCQ8117307.1 hypothetical protein [Methylomonas sp. WSC-7]OAI05260.1 hypothetical protein A1353_11830 [Methylomonas methanica]